MLSRFGFLFCSLINRESRATIILDFRWSWYHEDRYVQWSSNLMSRYLSITRQEWEDSSNMFVYIAYFVCYFTDRAL